MKEEYNSDIEISIAEFLSLLQGGKSSLYIFIFQTIF
jgi:hypothetical protein